MSNFLLWCCGGGYSGKSSEGQMGIWRYRFGHMFARAEISCIDGLVFICYVVSSQMGGYRSSLHEDGLIMKQ